MQELRIVFDTKEVESQMKELSKLLTEVFVEHLPDDIIGDISSLALDIAVTDGGTAVGAEGICEHRAFLRLGSRFHNIMTALRTRKLSDIAHGEAPAFRNPKL